MSAKPAIKQPQKITSQPPNPLTQIVSFRLTEQDHTDYKTKVERSGLSPSSFFRTCVLQNKTQVIAKIKPTQDKQKLIYLFNKTSNNLNQLAHKANSAHLAKKITNATYEAILSNLIKLNASMQTAINNVD